MKNRLSVKRIALTVALFLLAGALVFLYFNSDDGSSIPLPPPPTSEPEPAPEPEPEPDPDPVPELPEDGLPHDKLFITVERQHYKTGDLTLIIPKLKVNAAVQDGTTTADLRRGACLYEYAQLPGEGNRNVSIAAHRNGRRNGKVTEAMFYHVDKLLENDYLYLKLGDKIYRYIYKDTKVVEATDWGPIYSQGFSCLTLTSCEPIGVSTHRIIIRASLDEILDYDKEFVYESAKEESSS